jgi:tetratricopeptide (TPR) repeat protein
MIRKNLHTRRFWLVLLLALILFSTLVFAQEWRGKGRLQGVILNEDGQPIPDVNVTLTHVQYGATIEFTSDEKGKWVAANIRGGAWNIDFMADGYEPKQISTEVSEVLRAKPIEISLKRTEKSIVTDKVSELLASGNALYNQKNYQEAIQEYQCILEQNPALYMIHKNIGNAYYELGDYESAIEHYELVLDKEPDSTEVLISLGNMYLEKGDIEKGLSYFNQIDMEKITSPLTFYNIGTSFFNKGEVNKAVEYYNRAVGLDSNLSDAYYQLGLCHLNLNEKERAREYFQKFLELAPDSAKAAGAKEMLKFLEKEGY